jgi:hypothetical protein
MRSAIVTVLLASTFAQQHGQADKAELLMPCASWKILQNTCLPGSTYRSTAVNGTAAGCCAACVADGAKCVAWTVDTDR